jgi:hypothetical protein
MQVRLVRYKGALHVAQCCGLAKKKSPNNGIHTDRQSAQRLKEVDRDGEKKEEKRDWRRDI